jgi:hypothetical protein
MTTLKMNPANRTLYIPDSDYDYARIAAADRGISVSAFIRLLLTEHSLYGSPAPAPAPAPAMIVQAPGCPGPGPATWIVCTCGKCDVAYAPVDCTPAPAPAPAPVEMPVYCPGPYCDCALCSPTGPGGEPAR